MLWHCWLGIRKSICTVKNWVMRSWCDYRSAVRCKWFAYGPANATATPSSLASLKSILVLHFWYLLTQVAWKKRLLDGCLSVCVILIQTNWPHAFLIHQWLLKERRRFWCHCHCQHNTWNTTTSATSTTKLVQPKQSNILTDKHQFHGLFSRTTRVKGVFHCAENCDWNQHGRNTAISM